MSELTAKQAAEGLSNLAKQYASVMKAAEVLNEIGDTEARLKELQSQRDKAIKATEKATDAQSIAEGNLAEAEKGVDQAHVEAASLRKYAEDFRDQTIAGAKEQAKTILAEAEAGATEALALVNDQVAKQRTVVKALLADIEVYLDTKTKLVADIEAIKAKLG